MSGCLSFGISLDYQCRTSEELGPRLEELIEITETARDLGYRSIFGVHHYLANLATPQPLLVLARLIPHSGDMRLGTGVYFATVEHPVQLAETTATLDRLSGGRLVLGLGAGYRPEEFAAFGVDRATRWSRLEETVQLVTELWSGQEVDHRGGHFTVVGETIGVTPQQRPRPAIWVGANGPKTIERTVRIGDAWLAPPNVKEGWAMGNLASYRQHLIDAGTDPAAREYPIMRELYIGDSDESAAAEAGPYIRAEYSRLASYDLGYFQSQFDDLSAKAFLFGSPQTVTRRVRRLAEAGFTHFIFRTAWSGMPNAMSIRTLRRFAEEVIPALPAEIEIWGVDPGR